ncbi:hypothetical protein MBANPS3_003990 [Mucor bainieri]
MFTTISRQREEGDTPISSKKQKTSSNDDSVDTNNRCDECSAATTMNQPVDLFSLQITAKQALLESENLISAVNQDRDEIIKKKDKVARLQKEVAGCKTIIERNEAFLESNPPQPGPTPPTFSGKLRTLDGKLTKTRKAINKIIEERRALKAQLARLREQAGSAPSAELLETQQRYLAIQDQHKEHLAEYASLRKVSDAYEQYKIDKLEWEKATRPRTELKQKNGALNQKIAALTADILKVTEDMLAQTRTYSKHTHENIAASTKVNQQLKLILEQLEKRQPPMSPSSLQALLDTEIKLEPID